MRRIPLAAVLWFAVHGAAEFSSAQAAKPVLPGARPDVNAAEYPTIQSAIDALGPEGGVVRLPAGTFDIYDPLVISQGDVTLTGAGGATHIRNVNDAGKPAIVVRHSAGRKVAAKDRLWRVMLSDFRVTGNEKSGHGIEAIGVNEIFLQGVTVSRHGGDGIRLDDCYEDPRVADCLISYNRAVGLNVIACHDIVVSANHLEENRDALRCVDSFNLCMNGNNIDDHLRDGVVIENTYGSVVAGNMIEECAGRGVVLDRDCYGDTISANVIAHNGQGVVLVDAHGCAVSANTFTIVKDAALWIGPRSDRITVTGNNFSNSAIGDGKVKRRPNDLAAAGIALSGTSDVAITGNLFSSVRPKALELRDEASRRIMFSGNVLTDATSDHEQAKDSVVGPVLLAE